MIPVKNERELVIMRKACKITAAARALAGEMVRPGVTTKQIDKAVYEFILSQGAKPTFLGYGGFPASTCISVNEVIIHGIPGNRVLKEGDIVSVDVGATWGGFTGDCAATFACGAISPTAQKLITVTEQSFYEGIKFARQGNRISDIGHAVQTYVESHGFGVVRSFVGHGVGEKMHEDPEVPNYGKPGHGMRLMPGMTFCIEPMINGKGDAVRVLGDGWTVVTRSGALAAHFEHEIAVTQDGPVMLTRPYRRFPIGSDKGSGGPCTRRTGYGEFFRGAVGGRRICPHRRRQTAEARFSETKKSPSSPADGSVRGTGRCHG